MNTIFDLLQQVTPYLMVGILMSVFFLFSKNANAQLSPSNTRAYTTNATTGDSNFVKNSSVSLLDSVFNKVGNVYTLSGLLSWRQWTPVQFVSGLSDSFAPYVKTVGLGAAVITALGFTPAQGVSSIDTLQAARAFNTSYQMSTTKQVEVCPSAEVTCNLSLSGGQDGTITLQTSPDNITWTSKGQIHGSNTGTLTIGLATAQITGSQVCALLPVSSYWRLTTTNNTGSPTYTMRQGQKVIY